MRNLEPPAKSKVDHSTPFMRKGPTEENGMEKIMMNTSLAALGALAHRMPCQQNPKWQLGGPKMVDEVWKGVYPLVISRSDQLSLHKFFDPSTHSMRKGRDGEEWKKENGK